jgi:hypothetical protein
MDVSTVLDGVFADAANAERGQYVELCNFLVNSVSASPSVKDLLHRLAHKHVRSCERFAVMSTHELERIVKEYVTCTPLR